jgi:hypothetical protein
MLPLYGTATATRGFDLAEPRQVLRLRSLKEGPERPADGWSVIRMILTRLLRPALFPRF